MKIATPKGWNTWFRVYFIILLYFFFNVEIIKYSKSTVFSWKCHPYVVENKVKEVERASFKGFIFKLAFHMLTSLMTENLTDRRWKLRADLICISLRWRMLNTFTYYHLYFIFSSCKSKDGPNTGWFGDGWSVGFLVCYKHWILITCHIHTWQRFPCIL